MNIIRRGDHVFVALPVEYADPALGEKALENLRLLAEMPNRSIEFSVTTMPINPAGSKAEVLFVYREDKGCVCGD